MTLKDRTTEFNSVVENFRARKLAATNQPRGSLDYSGPNTSKRRTQFGLVAAQIIQNITETSEKLERLTKLARRNTLFDDPTYDIQELTSVINTDIKNINQQIAILQQQKGSLGSIVGRKNKQIDVHSDTVIDSLKTKLRETTKDFSQVLEVRTESIKKQQKERELFVGSHSPAHSLSRTTESPLYRAYSSSSEGGEVAIAMPQQQQLVIKQDRYLIDRAQAVRTIEITIGELQHVFQQLADLVVQQGELIERIDHDVSTTSHNVQSAQNELLRYLSYVSSNRWLFVKVFMALIVFAILFVVFFV